MAGSESCVSLYAPTLTPTVPVELPLELVAHNSRLAAAGREPATALAVDDVLAPAAEVSAECTL